MWASGDSHSKGVGLGALKSPHYFHLLPLSFSSTTDIILSLHPMLCKHSVKALPWLRSSSLSQHSTVAASAGCPQALLLGAMVGCLLGYPQKERALTSHLQLQQNKDSCLLPFLFWDPTVQVGMGPSPGVGGGLSKDLVTG